MVPCVKMQVGMKLDVFISIQDKIILILYKKVLILYISFPTKTAPGHIQNVKSCQACSVISIWNQLTNSSSFDDAIRSSANSMFGSLSIAERQLCYGISKNTYLLFLLKRRTYFCRTARTAVLYCLDLGDVLFCCLVYF